MIKLKLALRSIARYDIFSYFHGFGLAIAAIYLFVKSEIETDKHLSESEDIYRIIRKVEEKNDSYQSPTLAGTYNELISAKSGLPAEKILRIYQDDELISHEEMVFFESNVLYVDKNFLEILDFDFELGNPEYALDKPNAAVISKRIARKYFDEKNPIGELLEIEGKGIVQITGILTNENGSTHLEIDFLINNGAMGYANRFLTNHESHAFGYYLKIPQTDVKFVERSLNELGNEHLNKEGKSKTSLRLQPIEDIYFSEPMTFDIARHNDWTLIQTLTAIAIIILIVISANLINLNIAKLSKRVKQIGLKKALGSSKRSLIFEWVLEVYLMNFLATLVGLFCCYFILPYLFKSHQINSIQPFIYFVIITVIAFPALLTCIITAIPSILFSSINPFEALSGKLRGLKISILQHSLLSLQFAISFVMIMLSVVIVRQFHFMQSRDIGLNNDHVLVFDSNNKDSWKNKSFIANEIKALSGVIDVSTLYGGIPNSPIEAFPYEIKGATYQWNTAFAQPNLTDILDLKIIEGKPFDKSNSTGILINESAAIALGWPQNDLIGESIVLAEDAQHKNILGIIKDYHYQSFTKKIEPLVLQSTVWEETFLIKIANKDYEKVLSQIEQVWKKFVPKYPFTYRFLDDTFQQMHSDDTKNKKVIFIFTMLTILITSLGTLSMVALVQESKTKEITVRKILGAPVSSIFYLLSSNFINALLISCFIASPIAWMVAKYWLSDFSYRIQMSPMLFIVGSILLIAIIITTIIAQSWKTATLNPVDRLKVE